MSHYALIMKSVGQATSMEDVDCVLSLTVNKSPTMQKKKSDLLFIQVMFSAKLPLKSY